MAQTIPGGAYRRSDGKTWQDANGNEIKAPSMETLQAARERPSQIGAMAPDTDKANAEKVNAEPEVPAATNVNAPAPVPAPARRGR